MRRRSSSSRRVAPPPRKLLLSRGARGDLVRRVQERLAAAGFDPGPADSDYGPTTARAVRAFRKAKRLGAGEHVDAATWTVLVGAAIPTLRDRALQVTAAFEGHGYTLVEGNYDNAGLTWGIIGFTLKHGELARIVLDAYAKDPRVVRSAFGGKSDELLALMRAPRSRQLRWADSISTGPKKAGVAEPWRSGFRRLGELPAVRAIQLRYVDARFARAREMAREFELRTDLGIALCFDIVAQNGSVKPRARAQIQRELATHPIHVERDLRVIVAHAVADASKPEYKDDVRSRKLALATGTGRVHGATYVLRNWGLDGSPVRR